MDSNDINEPFIQYKEEDDQNEEIEKEIAQKIREGFIAKVFGIITYQVFLTSIVVCLGLLNSSFQEYLLKSNISYYTALFMAVFLLFLPLCYPNLFTSVPMNYIMITLFTLSYSWIIASITCVYNITSVVIALFLTLVSVITLTIYAWKTEKDFSVSGGTLFVCLVLLIFSSIISVFFYIPLLILLIIFISLALASAYLIYDIQLLIGKKRVKYSEDDYILAAIEIYVDIIQLFIQLLSIFGSKK